MDGLDQREQRGETARVIADAGRQNETVLFLHGNIGPFGKYRVQMRRDHQLRPAAATALAQGDDIAFGIDGCVLEAELLHSLQEIFRPDLLFERGRRNFGDTLLFVQSRRRSARMSWLAISTGVAPVDVWALAGSASKPEINRPAAVTTVRISI